MSHTNLTVVDHPVVRNGLGVMRQAETDHATFRSMLNWVSPWLCYEALRPIPEEEYAITTPLEVTTGRRPSKPVIGVPILRAGLGMVEGLIRVIPDARVGHLGMYRDPDTRKPVSYYSNMPGRLADARIVVLDPMLATGGSAAGALTELKAAGADDIVFVCLVAAPEGVLRLAEEHPDVHIFAAALDRELDENAYIRPGLGDAGDRIFGTEH